jgi:hypothetical protein
VVESERRRPCNKPANLPSPHAAQLRSIVLLNCGGIVDLMDHLQTRLDQEDEGSGAPLVCSSGVRWPNRCPGVALGCLRSGPRPAYPKQRARCGRPPCARLPGADLPPSIWAGEAPRLATELPHPDCRWYILDSHRPYNLNNVVEDDGKVRRRRPRPVHPPRCALEPSHRCRGR